MAHSGNSYPVNVISRPKVWRQQKKKKNIHTNENKKHFKKILQTQENSEACGPGRVRRSRSELNCRDRSALWGRVKCIVG